MIILIRFWWKPSLYFWRVTFHHNSVLLKCHGLCCWFISLYHQCRWRQNNQETTLSKSTSCTRNHTGKWHKHHGWHQVSLSGSTLWHAKLNVRNDVKSWRYVRAYFPLILRRLLINFAYVLCSSLAKYAPFSAWIYLLNRFKIPVSGYEDLMFPLFFFFFFLLLLLSEHFRS